AGKAKERVLALFCHQLGRAARASHHLPTAAGDELDVVNLGTGWHVGQRHRVPYADLRIRTAYDGLANAEAVRREDVPLFAINVLKQGDTAGAVRVVFNRSHACWHASLVALEIDNAVKPAMAAPA